MRRPQLPPDVGLVTRLNGLPGDENVAILPPGYRPAMTQIFTGESRNGVPRLDVRPDGERAYRSAPAQIERDNNEPGVDLLPARLRLQQRPQPGQRIVDLSV